MKVQAFLADVPGACEVVSLTTGADGRIYGGVTGAKNHLLFEYDPASKAIRDLGDKIVSANQLHTLQGKEVEQKIHHALSTLPDGRIAGGTGQNVAWGARYLRFNDDEGGHVFVYDPKEDAARDYGVAVPHVWIINTTTTTDGKYLCGMTYFHNDFFAVDLESGDVVFHDQVHAGIWGDSACSHTIACDRDGVVYGTCMEGNIFTFDVRTRKLTETDAKIPGKETYRLDGLILGPDGLMYGGTWETGILFSIEPGSLKVREICCPNNGPRLPALVVRDGKIYGAAGGGIQYKTRGAFLFEYDCGNAKYREIGPIVDEEQDVAAERVHAMTVGKDGTFYAGETGATRTLIDKVTGDMATGMNAFLYVIDA